MIYITIILFAIWNGLVVRWKDTREKKISNRWHMLGRVFIALMVPYTLIGLLPLWFVYVINPAMLLTGWHGATLGLLLVFGLSYWIYDIIINVTDKRGNPWYYHNSTKDPKFWKGEFYAWIAVTILWAIFGGMF